MLKFGHLENYDRPLAPHDTERETSENQWHALSFVSEDAMTQSPLRVSSQSQSDRMFQCPSDSSPFPFLTGVCCVTGGLSFAHVCFVTPSLRRNHVSLLLDGTHDFHCEMSNNHVRRGARGAPLAGCWCEGMGARRRNLSKIPHTCDALCTLRRFQGSRL